MRKLWEHNDRVTERHASEFKISEVMLKTEKPSIGHQFSSRYFHANALMYEYKFTCLR